MSATVVEIAARGDGGVSCVLAGDLIVPRLVRRTGRSVEVALVAGRAMLLPADEVRIRIRIGEDCALALVDIGGLVVYGRPPGEDGDASHWHADVELAPRARLTWDGLPTVVTDAGHLDRSLTLSLAPGASAVLRETLVLGRAGERGGRLRSHTDISDHRGPLLREALEVSGDSPVPGILGTGRVMDGIIAVGDHPRLPVVAGATLLELERCGTILRSLGDHAHASPLVDIVANLADTADEYADVA